MSEITLKWSKEAQAVIIYSAAIMVICVIFPNLLRSSHGVSFVIIQDWKQLDFRVNMFSLAISSSLRFRIINTFSGKYLIYVYTAWIVLTIISFFTVFILLENSIEESKRSDSKFTVPRLASFSENWFGLQRLLLCSFYFVSVFFAVR